MLPIKRVSDRRSHEELAPARVSRAAQLAASLGRSRVALSLCLVGATALGCGNAIYAFESSSAASKVEEARELGAEELAAFEYYIALEYLKKARSEAAEADYGDAINFAETSGKHADKAIKISRDAHRGAGR